MPWRFMNASKANNVYGVALYLNVEALPGVDFGPFDQPGELLPILDPAPLATHDVYLLFRDPERGSYFRYILLRRG